MPWEGYNHERDAILLSEELAKKISTHPFILKNVMRVDTELGAGRITVNCLILVMRHT